MKQLIDYKLLSSDDPEKFQKVVNDYLGLDYQLYGSPFTKGDYFYQAVIKREEKPSSLGFQPI